MQQNFLVRYLSLAPVLLFALLIATAVLLIEFNNFFPDLLFHPMP
ncbi:MAG: Photosystem I reaction center subunit IX [Heteroscytonema crispum UTEX LB 1556]|uniref:Photosystem I reaction center subunit IX n=1 Tax=Heteroscytonema crispum UTEX LB 1556 TaxID=1735366 RepID=A0A2L2FNX1_9CYAN|nr:photosystem I reaction center subunit IX [Heteroscytonema crispum UTEX LB 1556]